MTGVQTCALPISAQTVAAILHLPVDDVACDAEALLLLPDNRDIVPACSVACGHGWGNRVWAGVAAVNAVIFKHQRLMPMFLGSKSTGHILGTVHDLAALVVEAENGWDHIGATFSRL